MKPVAMTSSRATTHVLHPSTTTTTGVSMFPIELSDHDGDALTITTRGTDVWITCTTELSEVTIGPIPRTALRDALPENPSANDVNAASIEDGF